MLFKGCPGIGKDRSGWRDDYSQFYHRVTNIRFLTNVLVLKGGQCWFPVIVGRARLMPLLCPSVNQY